MRITIQNNHQVFDCNSDEAVLDAALRQGVAMPYGCRGGRCGNCIGTLVSGDIDYPDGAPPALADAVDNQTVFCQARAKSDLTIDVEIVATSGDIKPRKLPARVHSISKLAEDVVHLKLKIPYTERLQFFAGQYMDFMLSGGRRRAFSLANPPHHDEFLEFHIRHVPGGWFTSIVFDELKEKSLIRIEGPLGAFYLREDSDEPIIMMAGGTGIAPLRGMLLYMFDTGIERPVHLFWGGRAKQDIYLWHEIEQWRQQRAQFQFTAVLSDPDAADDWRGETGWVHEAVTRHYPDLSGYEIYMSGPPPMIDAARNDFHAHGLPKNKLFSDAFDFSSDPDISAAEKEAASE